ncbi:MAG: hypothetical protein HY319_08920 [Armatimonadetes bacterium]|nr:hypothetical protein [Armatimonadota bacterium]
MSRRGFTITEVILASFLLVAGFLIVARLFHAGLSYTARIENRVVALHLAETRMAQIKHWARTHNDWTGFPDGADPEYPGFDIGVALSEAPLMSPSTELEGAYPGDQRTMSSSARWCDVQVAWDGGQSRLRLVSLIGDRFRGWKASGPLVVEGAIPSPVTSTAQVTLTATGYDSSAQAIDDLFFRWYVEPEGAGSAKGTITPDRDGRSAVFENKIQLPDGTWQASTGQCRVRVRAVYKGEERWGETSVINLQP